MSLVAAGTDAAQSCGAVMLSTVLNLASAVIGGVVVAFVGVAVWRKQVRLKIRRDAAHEILRAACMIRRAIDGVRCGAMHAWEIMGRPDREAAKESSTGHERAQRSYRDQVWVYNNRFQHLQQARDALEAAELEAEVVLGREVIDRLEPLWKLPVRLRTCVDDYLVDVDAGKKSDEEILAVVSDKSMPDRRDDFGSKVDREIQKVRDYLRPYLEMKSRVAATGSSHGRTSCGASAKQDKPVDNDDKQQP